MLARVARTRTQRTHLNAKQASHTDDPGNYAHRLSNFLRRPVLAFVVGQRHEIGVGRTMYNTAVVYI